jgi:hypothetical protein
MSIKVVPLLAFLLNTSKECSPHLPQNTS